MIFLRKERNFAQFSHGMEVASVSYQKLLKAGKFWTFGTLLYLSVKGETKVLDMREFSSRRRLNLIDMQTKIP